MPKLPEFDAGRGQLTPNPQGEEAALRAGRLEGAFYHQIGQDLKGVIDTVEEHQTQQELSHGLATGTTLENNGDQGWSAYSADPANKGRPDLASSYRDHYDQQVDEWVGQFKTPKGKIWAEERGAQMKREMFQKTAAGQSALDAGQTVENIGISKNNYAARIGRDPSQYDAVMGTWKSDVEAQITNNANILPTQRAEVEERILNEGYTQFTEAYYQGAINSVRSQYATGATSSTAEDQVRKDLAGQRGFDHLSPEEQTKLGPALDEAKRQGQEQYKSGLTLAQKESDDEGRGVLAGLGIEVNKAITAGKPISPDLQQRIYAAAQKYPRLYGEFDPIMKAIPSAQRDAEAGTYTASDPKTEEAFGKRVLIPAGQPGALTVSEVIAAENGPNPRLSHDVAGRLLDQLEKLGKDPDLKQGYSDLDKFLTTAIRPQLTKSAPLDASGNPTSLGVPGVGGPDLQGDVAYQEAVREAHGIFEAHLRDGKTPAEAIEIMTNPGNNRSFYNRLPYFQNARHSPDAAAYFQSHPPAPFATTPEQRAQTPAGRPTAAPAPQADIAKAQANPIRPGESWTAYKARVGL